MSLTDDIKARIDLVSYIERHVPSLKKTGRYYKACCPFHDDKTPSFVVSPERGTWHCFGACATGGDIFTFYQSRHNVEFKDALRALAEEAGIEVPQYSRKQTIRRKYQRQLDLLEELTDSFHRTLLNFDGAWFVREYLKTRNISDQSIQQWRLGYAPKNNIIPKLLAKGYSPEDLLALGIAYESDEGELRSRFYNRLMIPIMDRAGQVVGFGARTLGNKGAKYINSHESELFQKSELLYGWHTARKAVKHERTLVIVEGYMDVMQAHQAGFNHVVGQMGTALTPAQVELIRDNHIKQIVLCLDGDEAGQQATDRAIDQLIAHAHTKNIRIVSLPEGEDPDSLIQSGEWEDLIYESNPVIDYLVDRHVSRMPENPSLGDRHEVANKLIPRLYLLEDNVSKLWGIQQLAYKLDMNPMALVDTAQQLMQAKAQSRPSAVRQHQLLPGALSHSLEAYVVYCLMEHPGWYWDIMGAFAEIGIPMLERNDFLVFGYEYQQVVDAVEGNSHPAEMIDIDPSRLSDIAPSHETIVFNALRLRLNTVQRTMDELVEIRDIERFTAFLAQRSYLQEKLGETV